MSDEADSQSRARVGCVLDDKWTLERLLGVGGMAAVYAGRHRNGARAAVKVLHPDLSRHKEVRERFVREGYAANRVEHPGAVKVLDDDVVVSGPESGTAYIVMELLEGESLQERLERGPPLGELGFLAIADSVLDVLEAAHARGVVHRDLKPENLFVLRDEPGDRPDGDVAVKADGTRALRVKVLDFGLARLLAGQAITSYGLALGTPSFMSPEQAAGRIDEIDGRTDLFALAATGFRICTGRRIHEAPNPVELVRKMAILSAPPIQSFRPEVSDACARVIDRALAFKREDRYESATAMREDVRRAIAELEARGPTQLALAQPLVPLPAFSGALDASGHSLDDKTTLEIKRRDPRPALPMPSAMPIVPAVDESIHIPRRRPVWPWALLLVAMALGGKVWFARRAANATREAATLASSRAAMAAAAASASDAAATPSPGAANAQVPVVVRDRDATAGAPSASSAPSFALGAPSGPPHPAAVPTTSTTHHPVPGKAVPGHKGTHKHHGTKTPPRTAQ